MFTPFAHIFYVVYFLLFISIQVVLADNISKDLKLNTSNPQEFNDTMNLLKYSIDNASTEYYGTYNNTEEIVTFTSGLNFTDCTIDLYQKRSNTLTFGNSISSTSDTIIDSIVDLKSICKVTMEPESRYPIFLYRQKAYEISLYTINSANLIQTKSYHRIRDRETTNSYTNYSTSLIVTDIELGERLVKAFKYASMLCGGGV